ncbi:MAG: flagellar biosynthesis protein FlhA [Candidatus Anammoxibacter sp.]
MENLVSEKKSSITAFLMPVALVTIIIILIVPIPAFLLDILITTNIALSILVLMVVLNTKDAVEISVYPSLLLFVTLFRLTINVASTKLILLDGYAGEVINAFGNVVVGGNIVVGMVVFLILVVIQFVVVNKGATRVSEVAARFTLDAMPGKQMSIDSDLNAGNITDQEAKERREKITKEAEFYGAMDGAGKFVSGDAIAGIIITFINLIGGIAFGVSRGMPIAETVQTYSILTIGDGLGAQIPSFISAVSMGLLITKTRSKKHLGDDISSQLFNQVNPLIITAVVLVLLSFLPGLPKLPFLMLAVPLVLLIRGLKKSGKKALEVKQEKKVEQKAKPKLVDKSIEQLLFVGRLGIEIGYNLIQLADQSLTGGILDRINMLRRELAKDVGFIVPPIRLRDNLQLESNNYAIKIKGQEIAVGELHPGHFLALDPGTATIELEGIKAVDPTYGMAGVWVTEDRKEHAEASGYTLVDAVSVLITHLSEVIKSHGHEIISREDVQKLIDNVNSENPAIVKEVVPALISLGGIHDVLKNLLRERVSIRDLVTILETIGDHAGTCKDPELLTEYVRQSISRTVCQKFVTKENKLFIVSIDPVLDQKISNSIHKTETGAFLALEPVLAQRFVDEIMAVVKESISMTYESVILSSSNTRMHIRKLIENLLPTVPVFSYKEVPFGIQIESVGVVNVENEN